MTYKYTIVQNVDIDSLGGTVNVCNHKTKIPVFKNSLNVVSNVGFGKNCSTYLKLKNFLMVNNAIQGLGIFLGYDYERKRSCH